MSEDRAAETGAGAGSGGLCMLHKSGAGRFCIIYVFFQNEKERERVKKTIDKQPIIRYTNFCPFGEWTGGKMAA